MPGNAHEATPGEAIHSCQRLPVTEAAMARWQSRRREESGSLAVEVESGSYTEEGAP